MTEIVSLFCLVPLSAVALMALWRVLNGPTKLDRVIGFDLLAVCTVAMAVLISIHWQTHLFVELMLIFSLLGFVGTIAFISYLTQDSTREKRQTAREAGGDY